MANDTVIVYVYDGLGEHEYIMKKFDGLSTLNNVVAAKEWLDTDGAIQTLQNYGEECIYQVFFADDGTLIDSGRVREPDHIVNVGDFVLVTGAHMRTRAFIVTQDDPF